MVAIGQLGGTDVDFKTLCDRNLVLTQLGQCALRGRKIPDYGQLMFGKSGFDGMRQQQVQQIVAHEAVEIDADARCDRIR